MTVTLRDLRLDDAAWLDGWLGACAQSVAYREIDASAPTGSLFEHLNAENVYGRVVVADGAAIGIAVWRLLPAAAALIEFVGVQPSSGRRGYGHQAAERLAEALRADGVTALFAPAPAIHGIAVYFWIRLGFRPLLQVDWPCKREGLAWLVRDVL